MNFAKNSSEFIKDAKDMQDAAVEAVDNLQRGASSIGKVVQRSAADIAAEITARLKEAGVDTDQLKITAREQADDVQRRLTDEIRERPLRALACAALAGVVLGLVTSR